MNRGVEAEVEFILSEAEVVCRLTTDVAVGTRLDVRAEVDCRDRGWM